MRGRRLALLVAAALTGPVAAFAVTGAEAAAPRTSSDHAHLNVGVRVLHFTSNGATVSARGLVTATLTDNHGRTSTIHTQVALAASTGGSCKVLHLFLNELTLQLLGLNAHLDKVTLDITGNAHGGVLGSLFCKLARAKVATARVAAVRRLNHNVHQQNVALRFTAQLSPHVTSSSTTSTCPVLDLVVGPLNLQLLGLVVDLQKVHLSVTATRGAGALGDIFCQLADNSTTTTTASSTTT